MPCKMLADLVRLRRYTGGVAEVLLFHHALGLTAGCRAFADQLRAAGHVVHTPDLFDGNTFSTVADGVGHAQALGLNAILERGRQAAEDLPAELVYAGFSLGVMPAQMLAQKRPGARGALLFHACLPAAEFGGSWPPAVPVEIHMKDRDPFALEGDLDAARQLAESALGAELFLYPGDQHLFLERSFADYDENAAALAVKRVLGFLERIPSPALRKGQVVTGRRAAAAARAARATPPANSGAPPPHSPRPWHRRH